MSSIELQSGSVNAAEPSHNLDPMGGTLTMTTGARPTLTVDEARQFAAQGFLVRRGQWTAPELAALCDHYTALHAAGSRPGCFTIDAAAADPLARWPRMMHPHRFDDVSRRVLLDPRMIGAVAALYDRPALAAQSMFYWKPPGARGQSLHQDDFYLRTRPGECLAAWLALDPAVPENGGLRVVPATHTTPLQCPHPSDPDVSFSAHEVELEADWEVVPVELAPGDILFFGGHLIHGSLPNRSETLWRRSLICHYVPADAAECARGYQPLLTAAGDEVRLGDPGPESDPCGGPAHG